MDIRVRTLWAGMRVFRPDLSQTLAGVCIYAAALGVFSWVVTSAASWASYWFRNWVYASWRTSVPQGFHEDFNAAGYQLVLSLAVLAAVVLILWLSYRPPARVEAPSTPLEPHKGLILTLSPFRTLKGCGWQAPAEANSTDIRSLYLTNWGPPAVAILHHKPALRHCWVLVTDESRQEWQEATRVFSGLSPGASFHTVHIGVGYDVRRVVAEVERVYFHALSLSLRTADVIADITSGLSSITAGLTIASLSKSRHIEYLRQFQSLIKDDRPLTSTEIATDLLTGLSTDALLAAAALRDDLADHAEQAKTAAV